MDKEKKNLFKYLLLFFVLLIYSVLLIPLSDDVLKSFGGYLIFIGICHFLLNVYLIVFFTKKAIDESWSRYLTSFFNLTWLHIATIIFLAGTNIFLAYVCQYIEAVSNYAAYLLVFLHNFLFLYTVMAFVIYLKLPKNNIKNLLDKYTGDKNDIGVIVYAFLIILSAICIVLSTWLCLCTIETARLLSESSLFNDTIVLSSFSFILFSIIMPVHFTKKAMDESWSRYLTSFFNLTWVHIILLILLPFISGHFEEYLARYSNFGSFCVSFYFVYLLICITILFDRLTLKKIH